MQFFNSFGIHKDGFGWHFLNKPENWEKNRRKLFQIISLGIKKIDIYHKEIYLYLFIISNAIMKAIFTYCSSGMNSTNFNFILAHYNNKLHELWAIPYLRCICLLLIYYLFLIYYFITWHSLASSTYNVVPFFSLLILSYRKIEHLRLFFFLFGQRYDMTTTCWRWWW